MSRYFILILFFSILFLTTACEDQNSFIGSANLIDQTRNLDNFTEVEVGSLIKVTIRQGSEYTVTLRANDNLIDQITTEQRGNTLMIELPNGSFREVSVEAEIVMPDLRGLTQTDASDGVIEGFLGLNNLRLEVKDAGDLTITNTSVQNLEAIVSGEGNINAFGLTAQEATVTVKDAGDLELTVDDRLAGTVADAGDLYYRGDPVLDVSLADAGELINAN